jgi:hypothetical protein
MKKYLGDSVYCEFDGDCVILSTENEFGKTNNVIRFDSSTYTALLRFVDKRVEEIIKEELYVWGERR